MYANIISFLDTYKGVDFIPVKERIKELRKEKDLQPKDFEEVGMSAKQYGQIEKPSCKSRPSLESLIKICQVLQVPLDDLLEGATVVEKEEEPKETKKAVPKTKKAKAKKIKKKRR